jgi:hypothetical protein
MGEYARNKNACLMELPNLGLSFSTITWQRFLKDLPIEMVLKHLLFQGVCPAVFIDRPKGNVSATGGQQYGDF